MLSFSEYSEKALGQAKFEKEGERPEYNFFGLAGEVGEVMEEIKKFIRGSRTEEEFRVRLRSELGDVLWYINKVADAYGFTLEEIAVESMNKKK